MSNIIRFLRSRNRRDKETSNKDNTPPPVIAPYKRKYADDLLLRYRLEHFNFDKTEHYEQIKKLIPKIYYTEKVTESIYIHILVNGANVTNSMIYDLLEFIIKKAIDASTLSKYFTNVELMSAYFASKYMKDYNNNIITNTDETLNKFKFLLKLGADINKKYDFTCMFRRCIPVLHPLTIEYPAFESELASYGTLATNAKNSTKASDGKLNNLVLQTREQLLEEELANL